MYVKYPYFKYYTVFIRTIMTFLILNTTLIHMFLFNQSR